MPDGVPAPRGPERRRRLRTRVLIASGALAVLVTGIFAVLFSLIAEQRYAERARDHGARIVAQANRVQKLTLDLETGHRGFIITAERRFLEPWQQARSAYPRELAALDRMSRHETHAEGRRLAMELYTAATSYLADYSAPLVATARQSQAAARRAVAIGEGKRRVDGIRSLVDRLIATEARHADEAADRAVTARREAIAGGAGGLAGALLLIVLFAVYVLRAVVRPVGYVADAADRLSGGDLSRRVAVTGPREVAQLGQSFNDMAAALERNRDERTQAEQALRNSEARLQAILDNSTAVIYLKDMDGRYLLVNRRFLELFDVDADRITGKTAYDLFDKEMADALRANDRRAAAAEAPIEAEEVVAQDGGDRIYLSVKFPLRDPDTGSVYATGGMSTDITDRKHAEEAAEEAKRQAETANQAKSRFLSRMSHELRTPLNAILGFGQLLELDELDRAQSESVDQILKGGRHLLRLIDEVLEISRIEAGELPISMEPVDISLALTEVVELMSPLAAERGVRMEIRRDGDTAPLYAQADYQRLRQVLLNLVSNAIKYNRPGGRPSVSAHRSPDERVRIVVADTGAGIAPAQLPRLFNPFDRLDADAGEVEGTGLGLALSKRLVEAMDGTIAAESAVGSGTTFTVELAAAEGQIESNEPAPARAGADVASTDRGRRTVLCIEDNISNVRLLKRIFAGIPEVDLLAAGQGSLGLELARQHRPALILLDLNLPDTSGEEVFRELQREEATRRVPVVVVSADATERQIERLLALGVRTYLTKPFNVQRLLEVVEDTLRGSAR